MKKSLSILLLLLPAFLYAQEEESRYIRNSITVLYVDYNDQYTSSLDAFYKNTTLSNRFDINHLGINCIKLTTSRDHFATAINGEKVRALPDRTNVLTDRLNKANAGREILAYLFNRQADGCMDLSRIEARGEYSAHDVDMTLSNSLKIGIAKVRDEGIQLIGRSYILVYDNTNLRQEYKGEGDSKELYWCANSAAYLFKLKFDEQTLYNFYDNCWLDKNTPTEEIAAKKAAFEQLYIPVECVLRENYNSSVSTNIETAKKLKLPSKMTDKERSEKAYDKLLNNTFSSLNYNIEKNNEDFVLKIPITGTAPFRAKIGTKEGVSKGLRFYVYNNRGKADGSIVSIRQGVLRATGKIANNQSVASGKSSESEFVKIAGYKPIEEGMTLKESKDYGFGLNAGGGSMGFNTELSYQLLKNRLTSSYAHIGLNARKEAYNIYFSLGYGLHIPNVEIYPYLGYGYDSFFDKDDDKNNDSAYSAQFIQYGVRANVAIYYPVYLFANAEFDNIISKGSIYRNLETNHNKMEGLNFNIGVRVCF